MKVLITGKNSYIGNSVKAWIQDKEPSLSVDEISLRNIDLNHVSFRGNDVILHVAGIAHISSSKKLIPEYFRINRDLAIQVAKRAKEEGVKQFIFLSSMSIYGNDRPIGDNKPIDIEKPSPTNSYGNSKLEADLVIQKLQNEIFKVCILRIPMVYGVNSKGNFPKLEKIAKKLSIYPNVENRRSVINIHSLAEFIRLLIIHQMNGVFFPQDNLYFSTSMFIKNLRLKMNKKTTFIPFFTCILRVLSLFMKPINKIYGNKFYEMNDSIYKGIDYQIENIRSYIQKL